MRRSSPQKDRDFTLSFQLSNDVGAQAQVQYSVELMKVSAGSQTTVDEKVYPSVFSIDQNTTIDQSIDYTVPEAIPAGTYALWIQSKNTSGLTLAVAFVGNVTIAASDQSSVEIVPNSCALTVTDATSTYALGRGLVNAGDTLTAQCQVASTFATDISMTPSFETRYGTAFGSIVPQTQALQNPITIHKGTNTVTVQLPQMQKPQSYDTAFSLVSADGKTISNTIDLTYTIAGQSGTIQNVVFDRSFYKAGETANLQVFATLFEAAPSTLTILVSNNSGSLCSATSTTQIPENVTVSNIAIPIVKDCLNPQAWVELSANGEDGIATLLDSQNFQITTPANALPKGLMNLPSSTLAIVLIILAIIIILGIIILIRKRKNGERVAKMLVLALLAGSAFLGFGKSASAMTSTYTFPSPHAADSITYTVNLNASSYTQAQTITVSGQVVTGNNGGDVGYAGINVGLDSNVNTTLISQQTAWSNTLNGSTNLTAPTSTGSHTVNSNNMGEETNNTYGDTAYYTVSTFSLPFTVNYATSTGVISASPNPVASGTASYISWNSTNANACTVTENGAFFASGVPSTYGSAGTGNGQFGLINGIAFDSSGNFYVVDANSPNRVQKFNSSGAYVSQFGASGSGNGQLSSPQGIAIDSSGNIYVADAGNNRIEKFSSSGTYVSQFGTSGTGNGQFSTPYAIAFDSSGNIYVADTGNNRVQKFNSSGTYVSQFGSSGTGNNQFAAPVGISIDSSGNIYVADTNNNRIEKFSSTTAYVSQFGSSGSGNGQLSGPYGILFDSSGNIYVSDFGNSRIQEFTSSGAYMTQFASLGNGTGQLHSPAGIALDASGNLWVVDRGNYRVEEFPPSKSSGPIGTNTSFGLTCTNHGVGTSTASAVVTLAAAPTVNLSANPSSTGYNGSTTLSWSAVGYSINSCLASSTPNVWSGSVSTSSATSTQVITGLTANTAFALTCSNSYGTTTATATVYAGPQAPTGVSAAQNINACKEVDVTWSGSAPSYGVYRNSSQIGTPTVTSYADTDPTLSYGTSYAYQASAYKNGLQSALSAASNITLQSDVYNSQFGSASPGNGSFNDPTGIAQDSSGNIYVVDSGNNRVQVFNSSGTYISQFGSYGSSSGQFNGPRGIALDSSGNIYVADNGNNRVEKFNSSGQFISTIGSNGSGNGQFSGPIGIAIPSTGNIYVTDSGNNRIEEFSSSTNAYLAQAGTSGNGKGQFNTPKDFAFDSSGNIWVVDSNNNRVEELNGSGQYVSAFGTSGTGNGQFTTPRGIVIDSSGNIYVSDYGDNRIQVFNSSGTYITQFGSSGSGNGQFSSPYGLMLNFSGDLYVTDSGNNRIQEFSPYTVTSAAYLSKFGSSGTGNGQFADPYGIAFDSSGNIWVVDQNNNRVEEFAPNGAYITQFGSSGSGNGQFNSPKGIAFDAQGNIYVADATNNRVEKFSSTTAYISQFGTSGAQNGKFNAPKGIAIDAKGNIYVSDYGNNRVEKFSSSTAYLSQFGSPAAGGTGNGQFNGPREIALDPQGNIYVTDQSNNRVQEFSSTTNAYVSQFGTAGTGNGQFTSTLGLDIDPSGNIYVGDLGDSRVEEFNSSQLYLSQFGSSGSGKGNLNEPNGIAIDGSGNIWVVDQLNNRIEEFSAPVVVNPAYLSQFGSGGAGNGTFSLPNSATFNSSGNMYVTDTGDNRVEKFDSSGNYLSYFGSSGSGNAKLSSPSGIDLGPSNKIYVADSGNNRIEIFNSNGTYNSQFGSLGSGNGNFNDPTGIGLDSLNNAYVVDSGNNRVEKFDSSGNYLSQFAPHQGSATFGGQLAIDPSNNLYVIDTYNDRIEEFSSSSAWISTISPQVGNLQAITVDSSGNIYLLDSTGNTGQILNASGTVIGAFGSSGSGNGQLSAPQGIALDSSNNIYVVDSGNNRVEKFVSVPCAPTVYIGSCSIVQTSGPGNGEVYVNKQATWTLVPQQSNSPSTIWSGTNISPTTVSGLNFSNIYTTVGPKTIYATTTDTIGGVQYQTTCFATTTAILDNGVVKEI